MDLWWLPVLFVVGLVAGFVDAIAGGGGLLTVPMLLAAGLSPQDSLGTNKFQSSFGTALATRHYARGGLLNWAELRVGLLASCFGALAGAWTVTRIQPDFLRPVIPILLVGIALYTWHKPHLGRQPGLARLPGPVFGLVFGVALGFYDGFFGPGTGSFWTVACVGLLGLDLLRATAYTKVMNLASNLVALAMFLTAGHVRFEVGLVMAAGQMIGGQMGAHSAVRGGARLIRPMFLAMVIALAIKLGWDALRK
ncbi:MAG TPA: TSUP family transporter [Verrucomicrobiota bacterium]|nr:hypothetical protein [Verrucomicrobiales bacterium]HRI13230.1 TSUP family transporter [Verrucomicrobiota bacterium]